MKIIAVIDADFDRGPLGTHSRLTESLAGEAVLRRTIRRVLEAKSVSGVHLVVPKQQEPLALETATGLNVRVETHDAGPPLWQRYVASSRKWSLDAWRGGITGTTMFDESFNPRVVEALARRENADSVAIVPAAAAIFDAALLDDMIAHYEKVHEAVHLTFTQSAPGLTAGIFSTNLLAELASQYQFIGRRMAYRPTQPQREMNIQPCFFPVSNVIAHAAGRCLADTQAGFDRVAQIIHDCGNAPDAHAASAWCHEHRLAAEGLPEEVEVELTTDDPLPHTTLRPRGKSVPARGPLSIETFERLVRELARRDDARLVLGGFGDPLMHPAWTECLDIARQAGIFAIAIRTPAVHLTEAAVDRIVAARVDLVNVLIDADRPQTYADLHGSDDYERVTRQVETLIDVSRRAENGATPLIVAEMIKTRRTMSEMESFYDRWINKGCGAVVVGPSHYGGRRPDLAVMDMTPPARFACQRPSRRCVVLADGAVTLCDEDFDGSHAVGHLSQSTLGDIWRGDRFRSVRLAHHEKQWNQLPLCGSCTEWHRP